MNREDGSIDRAPAREERTDRGAKRTRLSDGADRPVSGASEALGRSTTVAAEPNSAKPEAARAPAASPPIMTPRQVVGRIGFYTVIALATAFFALPMLWLLSTPFDDTPGLSISVPDLTLNNFRDLRDNPYALGSLVNSILLAVGTALLVVVFAALASYSLSRVRIPGRDMLLYALLLLSSIVTGTAAMVPIFLMMFELGLIDSQIGVILVLSCLLYTSPSPRDS